MDYCPYCGSKHVNKCGHLPTGKQKYVCRDCHKTHSDGNPIKIMEYGVCPHCGGKTRKSGHNKSGSQRWLCLDCGKKSSGETTLKSFQEYNSEVECPYCHGHHIKKGGKLRSGVQRYECKDCKRFFSDNTVLKPDLGKICPYCGSHEIGTAGHNRNGTVRYRCKDCKRRFVENPQQKPVSKHYAVCPRCGHTWGRKAGHTGSGAQYYKCLNCDHKFLLNPVYKQFSDEQKQKLYSLKIQGIQNEIIAKEMDCSVKTISNIFREAPEDIKKAYTAMKVEKAKERAKMKEFRKLWRKKEAEIKRQKKREEKAALTDKIKQTKAKIEKIHIEYRALKRLKKWITDFRMKEEERKRQLTIRERLALYKAEKQKAEKERNMIAQKGITLEVEELKEVKEQILSGVSIDKILEDHDMKKEVVKQLESIYTRSETLTPFQEDMIVKFGIGCGVPVDYLAPYVPCSQKACKKILSRYKRVERPKVELSQKDRNFDKLLLDKFLA